MQMVKRIDVVLYSQYGDLLEKYEALKEKHRKMEKDYKNLQVEHSRLLFDMDAVIEHEVKKKLEKFYRKK